MPAHVDHPTPAERVAWLRAQARHAEILTEHLRGAYLPRAAGGMLVCSIAIEIEPWYGVADERWELTRATTPQDVRAPSENLREELARIGIHDCVLDPNR